jgi:ComF family protein
VTLREIADAALSALLAPPCAVCGDILRRPLDSAVCDRCWNHVVPVVIAFPVRTIARAQAIGRYESTLRDLIHAFKYDGRRSIGPRLSGLMAASGTDLLRDADCVVPVPLHPRRRRQRGFNQADDLARGLGLPVICALRRIRGTHPQVELPAHARRDNVKDAFSLRGSGTLLKRPSVSGAVVVLVDDVATTGATLEACARVLRAAGVAEVRALTAARAEIGPRRTPHA